MHLTRQQLNRTLLDRQGLLSRTTDDPLKLVHRLVGLQAQENLPPYLSLAARVEDFDPVPVSEALADRRLVRMTVMRGTIHLLSPDDALTLRQFTQPCQDRERKVSENTRPALHLDTEEFNGALREVLAEGPLAMKALGVALAERFPDVPPGALAHLARVNQPLVQLPPRGQWKASGGVVYQYVDRWLDRPLGEPDVEQIVLRYLRAFGPASSADLTAWSGVTALSATLKGMARDGLVRELHDEHGKTMYDVPGLDIVDDADAPVRLLGTYDNLWLSHAARDRVTEPEKRKRWMGRNGGVGSSIFVNGWLEGLWRVEGGHPIVVELFRDLTASEKSELDEELARMDALLAR